MRAMAEPDLLRALAFAGGIEFAALFAPEHQANAQNAGGGALLGGNSEAEASVLVILRRTVGSQSSHRHEKPPMPMA
jgi:hypothetical protein